MRVEAGLVRRADCTDLVELTRLFDLYRQFYRQPTDELSASRFLADRLSTRDTIILVAPLASGILGFAHLFPSFSSVHLQRTFILNDLFVAPEARQNGVGGALVDAAALVAGEEGAGMLTLATGHNNSPARGLYESRGWVRDEQFVTYNLLLASERQEHWNNAHFSDSDPEETGKAG